MKLRKALKILNPTVQTSYGMRVVSFLAFAVVLFAVCYLILLILSLFAATVGQPKLFDKEPLSCPLPNEASAPRSST